METYLTEVRLLRAERRVAFTWSDGHAATFDDPYLRGYCPCAMCQGHDALEIKYHEPPPKVRVTAVEPVGSYGISIAFSDGHATGIYRFEFLRRICPCEDCRRDR